MLNLNRQEKTGCYFYGKEGSRVTIGDKIKALRTERGMSQDAVASALSVTRQAVAKWESNQSVPSTTNTIRSSRLYLVMDNQPLHFANFFPLLPYRVFAVSRKVGVLHFRWNSRRTDSRQYRRFDHHKKYCFTF